MAKTLRKFRVKSGSHSQDGKVYMAADPKRGKPLGDVVSSPHNLCKQWPNKFEEVDSDTAATKSTIAVIAGAGASEAPPIVKQPEPDAGGADDTDEDADDAESALGQDVTEKFPKAVEQDFKVYKREGQYHVYDMDDLTKPVAPGTKKAGVDEVIAAALKGK